MNGPHDLGGQHGLGPIELEPNEPLFHAPWERRAFALTLAMGARGEWNLDMSRHAREDQHPVNYLSSSYYQIWLAGLERLMLERGLVTEEELQGGPRAPRSEICSSWVRCCSGKINSATRPARKAANPAPTSSTRIFSSWQDFGKSPSQRPI